MQFARGCPSKLNPEKDEVYVVAGSAQDGFVTDETGALLLVGLDLHDLPFPKRSVCYNAVSLFREITFKLAELYHFQQGDLHIIYIANYPSDPDYPHRSHTPVLSDDLERAFLAAATATPSCLGLVVEELVKTGLSTKKPPQQMTKAIFEYGNAVASCPRLKRPIFTIPMLLDFSGQFAQFYLDLFPQKLQEAREVAKQRGETRFTLAIGLPRHAAVILGEDDKRGPANLWLVESRNYQRFFDLERRKRVIQAILDEKGLDAKLHLISPAIPGVQDVEARVALDPNDPQGFCATWAMVIANTFRYTRLSPDNLMRCLSSTTGSELRDLARRLNEELMEDSGSQESGQTMWQGSEQDAIARFGVVP